MRITRADRTTTPRLAFLLLPVVALLGCASVIPQGPSASPRPPISTGHDDFVDPGWFDLAAGVGAAFNTVAANDNDVVGAFLGAKAYPLGRWYASDRAGRMRTVRGRESIFHRASVVGGVSVGEFTGSDVRSPIYVVGLGVDVAPQLMLIGGISLFEEERSAGGDDTDFAFYAGAALNLRGIWETLKGLGSGGSGSGVLADPAEPDPVRWRDPDRSSLGGH